MTYKGARGGLEPTVYIRALGTEEIFSRRLNVALGTINAQTVLIRIIMTWLKEVDSKKLIKIINWTLRDDSFFEGVEKEQTKEIKEVLREIAKML